MLRAISRGLVPVLLAVVSVSAADGPVIKFTDVKLKNGLRVIISEDHSAPTVSVVVNYFVGSADEKALQILPSTLPFRMISSCSSSLSRPSC